MDDGGRAPTRHKLDVETLYRMADAGIFGEDDRIELIDGELIDRAPIGPDHAAAVNGLTRLLVRACGEAAIVSVQSPTAIDSINEPQPDFTVVDLKHRVLTAYTNPVDGEYTTIRTHQPGDTVALSAEPTIAIDLVRIFA